MILGKFPEYVPTKPYTGIHYSMKNENDIFGIPYVIYNEESKIEFNFKCNFKEFYRRFKILYNKGFIHMYVLKIDISIFN